MPDSDYLIQSPQGDTITPGMKSKLRGALDKVGVPSKDWRYVVLPDQDWKDMTASSPLPHPTDTTFSNLPAHVTYIHQSLLQKPDDAVTFLMAHEQGHQRLNTTSEDKANEYAHNSMAEIKKYGRSNNAANQDLQSRVASESNQFQTTPAAIQTQLVSPNSSATLSAPYKGSVQSVLDRAPQTTYAQRVMASKPYQSHADKVMASKPSQHAAHVASGIPQSDSIDDSAKVRAQNFVRNQTYAKSGTYITKLSPADEAKFKTWVKTNHIPWNDTSDADYDMRGYWMAQQKGNPVATRAANLHFPDQWKTPYDATFSNQSQYATPKAPHWVGNTLVATHRVMASKPVSKQ